MVVSVKAKCLGKSKEPSKKSGKFHYLFVVGNNDSSTGLFTDFTAFDAWAEDKAVEFGAEYNVSIDLNGDKVFFKGFVE